VKKVLSRLDDLASEDADVYCKFYGQYGAILREGVSSDFGQRDAIAKLLRFKSSHGDDRDALTSLTDYVSRMPDGQTQIYYAGGPEVSTIERSPNLEAFRAQGLDVLYLTDPVDEFVLNNLQAFEEKPLVSIDADNVELPGATKGASDENDDSDRPDDKTDDETPAGFNRVLEMFKEALGDRVQDVRKSDRLTSSACCLVSPEGTLSAQLQKVLSQSSDEFRASKRIFEVNPSHSLITRLVALATNADHDEFVRGCCLQLFTNAQLMEGVVPDAHDASERMLGFMQEVANHRSPIAGA
jgi:molecular chaperone HtpG